MKSKAREEKAAEGEMKIGSSESGKGEEREERLKTR